MAIRIVTDSTSDVSREWARDNGITVVPLRVTIGGATYTDGVDLSREEFYRKMAASAALPTTSQVNPDEFERVFRPILESGDEVLGVFISSELSGTCQSAHIAAQALETDRIRIVDSRHVSLSLALLLARAVELVSSGCPLDQAADALESEKRRVRLLAVMDSLHNLKKGGRLSPTSAIIGTILGMKPIIAAVDGRIEAIDKARGFWKSVRSVMGRIKDLRPDWKAPVCVGHSNRPGQAAEFEAALRERFPMGTVMTVSIGPVVGTHSGEGCVGVAFLSQA